MSQPSPSPQPSGGSPSRKLWWIGGAAVAAVVVLVAVIVGVTRSGSGGPDEGPMPAAAAKDLLIADWQFPSGYGEQERDEPAGGSGNGGSDTSDPCSGIMSVTPTADDAASVDANAKDPGGIDPDYKGGDIQREVWVNVFKPASAGPLTDFDGAVRACAESGPAKENGLHFATTELAGAEGDVHAVRMTRSDEPHFFLMAFGVTRNVGYTVNFELKNRELTDADRAMVVDTFNKQRQRILDAA